MWAWWWGWEKVVRCGVTDVLDFVWDVSSVSMRVAGEMFMYMA